MKSKIINYVAITILLFTLSSCLNQYEKEVIGNYELYQYELNNTKFEVYEFTKIIIKKDKTFEIKFENEVINGNWKADDNGDWTYIELEINNQKSEGIIRGNSIFLFRGNSPKEFK